MMNKQEQIVRFAVIGCGLMGRQFAAAAGRWSTLDPGTGGIGVRPEIVAVCDLNDSARSWFTRNVPGVATATDDYRRLLDDPHVEALYVAVPHDLHEQVYVDAVHAGKHLLGEKPFGIDASANTRITETVDANPNVFVRCSSEIPFYPGAQRIVRKVLRGDFGRIIEVEAGFWHSSDLNPDKPINWKRQTKHCGEYGVLGDLGMHPLHLPLRFGWKPADVRCLLGDLMCTRPAKAGSSERVACDTWENGTMLCHVTHDGHDFPMTVSVKRVAPGHNNTWFLRVVGTDDSAYFSTQFPKQLQTLPYRAGGPQAFHVEDVPFDGVYPTTEGGIFEFGLADAVLQMWAAFCDEMVHGRDDMRQPKADAVPFYCVTPAEAADHHAVLTAALASHRQGAVVRPRYPAASDREAR